MSPPACAARFTAVLTRPAGQSDSLIATLQAEGIDTIDFPLIDIGPVTDPDAIDALDTALRSIDRFSLVFFVSPNAIAHAFSRAAALGVPLAARLSARPIVAVVGPGSVQALNVCGVGPDTHRIVAPFGAMQAAAALASSESSASGLRAEIGATAQGDAVAAPQSQAQAALIRYDSEALMAALDALGDRSTWAGKQVLIVRGDGGREWFADAMRAAHASVHAVTAYRRGVPTPNAAAWERIEALLDSALTPRPYAWVLSSSEGVRNLIALAQARFVAGVNADAEADAEVANRTAVIDAADSAEQGERAERRYRTLLASPVIVPHARIGAAASAAGFDTITNPGAGDMNIVRAIRAASERMKKSKGNYSA